MTLPPSPFWQRERHMDRRPFLRARANIVRAVRAWFHAKGFMEAEPDALVRSPGAETHIDAFESEGRYLHTSPEFAMKKLLAAGEERLFYLGKCWRRGETGPLHAQEFTMLEWYRVREPYETVMADCTELLRVACDAVGAKTLRWWELECDPYLTAEKLTVAEAFQGMANVDVLDGERSALAQTEVRVSADDSWSDLFSRVLVEKIEPNLGLRAPTLLTEYPIQEAALARPCAHDRRVAERFELYACGVELANGFGELTDPIEQRKRLEEAMAEKHKRCAKNWPIDEDFLAALARMPPASGVALGLDRLVMLATGARHINDVLWTPQ